MLYRASICVLLPLLEELCLIWPIFRLESGRKLNQGEALCEVSNTNVLGDCSARDSLEWGCCSLWDSVAGWQRKLSAESNHGKITCVESDGAGAVHL